MTLKEKNSTLEGGVSDFHKMDLNLLSVEFLHLEKVDIHLPHDLCPFILQIFITGVTVLRERLF